MESITNVSAQFSMPSQQAAPSDQPLAKIERDQQPLQPTQAGGMTPARMIEMAFAHGASMDQLERLFDMHERWEKNEARKAFVRAMTEFKALNPAVTKNRHVFYKTAKGNVEYDHATLDNIADEISPMLSHVGLTYRWVPEQKDGEIHITCVLTHAMGHSESATFSGPPDYSGSKNDIQAVGSTAFYLERYSLLAVTGIAPRGLDNDGRGAPDKGAPSAPATLNADQIQELRDAAADAGVDEAYVCQKANVQRIDQIPAARFGAALNHLQRKAAAAAADTSAAQGVQL